MHYCFAMVNNLSNAVFTARCYAQARSLLSAGVRHTLVDCIQTAEDIVKLLSWPGSPLFEF